MDWRRSISWPAAPATMWAWWASTHLERLTRKPVEVALASEFRYMDPIVSEKTLVIVISQSGETLDTMAALREARRRGGKILSIVNVVGSSIARESDQVLYTWAGPEIAVATTKAYSTQLAVICLLALYFGKLLGTIPPSDYRSALEAFQALPEQVEQVLSRKDDIQYYALPVLQPRQRVLHRAEHRLRPGAGGVAEAQGDLLHPLGGLRRRRAEARHHLPHRGRLPGGGPWPPAPGCSPRP